MKARISVLCMCVSFAAAAALAHGGETHVIGTVAKVTAASITVKTTAKEMITVSVVVATTFTNSKDKVAAKFTDLVVGDRVVIHAKEPTEGTLVADTVEFAPPPSKPTAKPAQ
jgi:hypothetical protein